MRSWQRRVLGDTSPSRRYRKLEVRRHAKMNAKQSAFPTARSHALQQAPLASARSTGNRRALQRGARPLRPSARRELAKLRNEAEISFDNSAQPRRYNHSARRLPCSNGSSAEAWHAPSGRASS
jgi:hypothetical protein